MGSVQFLSSVSQHIHLVQVTYTDVCVYVCERETEN
jgi:hypothetical protein